MVEYKKTNCISYFIKKEEDNPPKEVESVINRDYSFSERIFLEMIRNYDGYYLYEDNLETLEEYLDGNNDGNCSR